MKILENTLLKSQIYAKLVTMLLYYHFSGRKGLFQLMNIFAETDENFSSIPLFVQILWPFEYFRVLNIEFYELEFFYGYPRIRHKLTKKKLNVEFL